MIIDVRTRAWTGQDPLAPARNDARTRAADAESNRDATPHAHRRAMSVVDGAVVVGWRADRCGVHVPGQSIAAIVNESPDRLIGFAPIDATSESALDDVSEAVELGMRGLTLSPADQGCRPTDDRAMSVFESAARRGMPVLVANPCIDCAASVMEFARPALLDEAARAFPALTLVLGDAGHAWTDEALLLALRHERVHVELSGVVARPWALYTTLMHAFERGATGKLLFASGFPRCTPEKAVESIYTVNAVRGASSLPGVPRETLKSIVERDALHAMGLERLPRPAASRADAHADGPGSGAAREATAS